MASVLINRKLNAVGPRRRWAGVYRLHLVCFANESSSPLAIDQEDVRLGPSASRETSAATVCQKGVSSSDTAAL